MTRLVALVALLAVSAALHAEDNPDAGLSISFGQAAVGSDFCFGSLLVAQELGGGRWLGHLSTHGDGDCGARANIGAGLLRTTHLGEWAFGIGAGFLEHGDIAVGPAENPDRPQLAANLLIRRYLFRRRVVLDLIHWSTGGSTYWNVGLNSATIGVRF